MTAPAVRPVSVALWMARLKVLRLTHAWPDPTAYQDKIIALAKVQVELLEDQEAGR